MTREEAEKIVARHRNEKRYSSSCLQVGEVDIVGVYEDGFTFTRKTEYIETVGIYEEVYETTDIFDSYAYNIAEVVTKHFK